VQAVDWQQVALGALAGGVTGATFGLALPVVGGVAASLGLVAEGVTAVAAMGPSQAWQGRWPPMPWTPKPARPAWTVWPLAQSASR